LLTVSLVLLLAGLPHAVRCARQQAVLTFWDAMPADPVAARRTREDFFLPAAKQCASVLVTRKLGHVLVPRAVTTAASDATASLALQWWREPAIHLQWG
jgi:hypothetical protein